MNLYQGFSAFSATKVIKNCLRAWKKIYFYRWVNFSREQNAKKTSTKLFTKIKLWSINRTYDLWFLRDVKWMPRICDWKKTFLLSITRSEKLLNFSQEFPFFIKPSWSFLGIQKSERDTTWIGNESAFRKVLSDCFCFIKHQSNEFLPSYTLNLIMEHFF